MPVEHKITQVGRDLQRLTLSNNILHKQAQIVDVLKSGPLKTSKVLIKREGIGRELIRNNTGANFPVFKCIPGS